MSAKRYITLMTAFNLPKARSMSISVDPISICSSEFVAGLPNEVGRQALALLTHAVACVVPDWSVEWMLTCSEEVNLVVMPANADDLLGPTFIIRCIVGGYCLDQFHWDHYGELGRFSHLSEAVSAVQMHIHRLCDAAPIPFLTRH